jgi:hypothetical protein
MREGKARRFASVRAIFLGYHPVMHETVVPGAIMIKIGHGAASASESVVFA